MPLNVWILPKQLIASSGSSVTEGIISDLKELSQACAASLLVKSKLTRWQTWSQKWKRDAWTRFLSGRMLKLSHAKCFEDWWISSLPVTPVRDSARPVSRKVLKTLAFYGLGVSGQLQLWNLATCSSRMSPATSRLDSPQSLAIWKKQVIKLRQEYSQRLNAALRNRESESSSSDESWQTPVMDPKTRRGSERGKELLLAGQALQNWATPKASESGQYQRDQGTRGKERPNLTGQAKGWPTIHTSDAEKGGPNSRDGTGSLHLCSAVQPQNQQQRQNWATPQTFDATGIVRTPEKLEETRSRSSKASCVNLREQVHYPAMASAWPTPSVRDEKGANGPEHMKKERPHLSQLPNAVLYSGQDSSAYPANLNRHGNPRASLKLNADWVEALMDVPPMWTDCDYLETESIPPQPQKPLSHSTES
jgi:hypothetical protein